MSASLSGHAATSVTRRIVALAESAGLRPNVEPAYRGAYRIIVNAPGQDGLFGGIAVGARTGRILHAHLTHGNWGEEKRYGTVADIRRVFKSWAALNRIAS